MEINCYIQPDGGPAGWLHRPDIAPTSSERGIKTIVDLLRHITTFHGLRGLSVIHAITVIRFKYKRTLPYALYFCKNIVFSIIFPNTGVYVSIWI